MNFLEIERSDKADLEVHVNDLHTYFRIGTLHDIVQVAFTCRHSCCTTCTPFETMQYIW